ncbi:Hypothetical protein SRAE_1000262300 [Strongyloides ratti]|uniref:Histone-fold domain-containing protein n=1 Tax=Strongyloides ratti TaxID=34506 RepID=A0A090MWW0_STRRB|nr:Hypothetical protein SRAE_1000262300 [Strongyloides ratti]CEF64369.1 Hypothetical protein SRAE_1000262300 [Strongyloides ratti]
MARKKSNKLTEHHKNNINNNNSKKKILGYKIQKDEKNKFDIPEDIFKQNVKETLQNVTKGQIKEIEDLAVDILHSATKKYMIKKLEIFKKASDFRGSEVLKEKDIKLIDEILKINKKDIFESI